jgi:hypothetical protein
MGNSLSATKRTERYCAPQSGPCRVGIVNLMHYYISWPLKPRPMAAPLRLDSRWIHRRLCSRPIYRRQQLRSVASRRVDRSAHRPDVQNAFRSRP